MTIEQIKQLAEEYYNNISKYESVVSDMEDDAFDYIRFATDFAQFYHEKQQENLAEKMELPKNINSFNRMQVVEFAQCYHEKKMRELWKPIILAPKDGTRIMVMDKDGSISIVAWLSDNNGKPNQKNYMVWAIPESWQDEQGGFCSVDYPIKWMSLSDLAKTGERSINKNT